MNPTQPAAKDPGARERRAWRRHEAFELRKRGIGYRAIGQKLGVSVFTAHSDVMQFLKELKKCDEGPAEDVRKIELARLDGIIEHNWPKVAQGDPQAAGVVLRAIATRADLCGLNAPTKLEHAGKDGGAIQTEVHQIPDVTRLNDDELADLRRLLARATRAPANGNGTGVAEERVDV